MSEEQWYLPTLYKRSANGKVMSWQVSFDGEEKLLIRSGYLNGKIKEYSVVITPKVNRDMQQQALQEANNRFDVKYHAGYRSSISVPTFPAAMLAGQYREEAVDEWPVYVQPKLNGIRMRAMLVDGQVIFFSRREHQYHLEHLEEEAGLILRELPEGSILDGELYNPELDFTEITSIVRTRKTLHPRTREIFYYIFDLYLPSNPGYHKRYELLTHVFGEHRLHYLHLLHAELAYSPEEILQFHHKYSSEGYEGVMIKLPSRKYQGGRTNNVMKLKNFTDEEALVIGVEDATGTEKGAAMLVVRDERGNEFSLRMHGSFERRKRWLKHPEEIIGKYVTLRYQTLSIYGVPLFPVGIEVRDYE